MGCDAGDACVHDHVRPWLREPKIADNGRSYTALAPCHADATCSLTVSAGDHQPVVWCCHACQERLGKDAAQIRTRHALIRSGVPARCLSLPREQVDSIVDDFRALLHADISQVEKVYRLSALIECGEMPKGGELDRLAEWCGVSRRAAYSATREPGSSPLATPDNL